MSVSSHCISMTCNTEAPGIVKTCPACGKKMRTSKTLRLLGLGSLVSGLVILGVMGTVTVYLTPMLLHPNTGGSQGFTGTAEQGQQALWLFAALLAFGAFAAVTGGIQVATGKRNRVTAILALVFAAGVVLLVRHVSHSF